MNKVKVFFIAAALVLTTAGVFAGKTKFFTAPPNVYYFVSPSTYNLITGSTPSNLIENAGGTPATLKGSDGTAYSLYYQTGTHYYAVDASF